MMTLSSLDGGGVGAASSPSAGSSRGAGSAAGKVTSEAVWCDRGCGGVPEHSLISHSFFSTLNTCVSLYLVPL